MKKSIFILFILFSSIVETNASHVLGGEVRWHCLSDGRFIFYADLYKDCGSGSAGVNYINHQIEISGTPLPTNAAGINISQITVKPDSNRWANANNGDISPDCQRPGAMTISCSGGDNGAVQWYPFVSDPIQLKGTPPISGWTFKLVGPSLTCCRSGLIKNLVNPGSRSFGMRAKMFPIPNPNGTTPVFLPVDVCQDSSPEFAEKPANLFCRDYEFTFSHNAKDSQLDSLVYSFDTPLDYNDVPINFSSGYSFTNPLPNQSFDSLNIPVSLNPLTGEMKQGVYSGSGVESFIVVVRVDSWRCGRIIASVWRDMPFVFFDCSLLPNGNENKPPQILFNGSPRENYLIEAVAGQKVKLNFQSSDNDLDTSTVPPFQKVTLEPNGFLFSQNFSDPFNCATSVISPCATLNPPPTQSVGEPYRLSQLSSISTEFNWQTDCKHIAVTTGGVCGNATGVVGAGDGIFNFVMKSYDDHCPIPSINYPTITVKVKAPIPLINPIIKGVSVGLDGKVTVNWVPPIDSVNTFEAYDIDAATVNNGNTPGGSYITAQALIKNYKQEKTFPFLNFPVNLYTPFPGGKDYYFRMITYSGCTGDIPSLYSEAAQVMELDANPTGPTASPNSVVTLNWNRPKPQNAQTSNQLVYESRTRFYVYENVEASDNDSLADSSKWTLIGNTYGTAFTKGSSVCNDLVGYRVEARDTVVTFKQGYGLQSTEYDTLIFSTYSIIDVMQQVMAVPNIEHQVLESISSNVVAPNYQWYDCNSNSIIQNETLKTFIPKDTGRYRVEISNDTCTKTSDCFSISTILNDSVTQVDNQTLVGANVNQKFQWIDCRADTIIPGATNQTYIPADTGYYAVIVSAYGYKDTSRCIPMIAIGIVESQFEKSLSISPNPNNGQFIIQSNAQRIRRVRMYNINGQLISDFTSPLLSKIEFNIQEPSGIYFLEIEGENGTVLQKKVLKR